MAGIPALSKTWQIVPNMPQSSNASVTMLNRVQALTGTAFGGYQIAQNACTVVRSSNGVTVADSNLWLASGDIIRGATLGTARSWIVLQNALGRQLLIDYVSSSNGTGVLSMSPAGLFTGGTTTAKPTAADELNTHGFAARWSNGTVNQHLWVSGDGKQIMMGTANSGYASDLWIWGDVEDPPPTWTRPCILYADNCSPSGFPGLCIGRQMIGLSGSHPVSGEITPGVNATIRFITEAIDGAPICAATNSLIDMRNEVSVEWDFITMGQLQAEDAALWGPLGYWPDIYATPTPRASPQFLAGDDFPADGSRVWVKWDDLALPWGLPVDLVAG